MSDHHDRHRGADAHSPETEGFAALELWLRAEDEGREDAAEEALAALFADLPRPSVPVMLTQRLEAVAAEAAAERKARLATVFGLAPRTLQRLAAGLVLAVGVAAAFAQTLLRDSAGASLERMRPARVISSFAEGAFGVFSVIMNWMEAGIELFYGATRLSGAAATVAGTAPVAVALLAGLVLAGLAFKLLRDLIGTERGFSHVDHD